MESPDEIKLWMKVRVIKDEGTMGMIIRREYLDRRAVGKVGIVIGYVSGHGGDVWWVEQDDGIAAYSFTEIMGEE